MNNGGPEQSSAENYSKAVGRTERLPVNKFILYYLPLF